MILKSIVILTTFTTEEILINIGRVLDQFDFSIEELRNYAVLGSVPSVSEWI